MIEITTTSDIDTRLCVETRDTLRSYVDTDIDERQMFFKSIDAPSWIALVGDLPTWQFLLVAAGAVYLKEILKEAAKDHWRDRRKIITGLRARAVTPVLRIADALARLRASCHPRTDVVLVLSWPDDFHGTRLVLQGRDTESLAAEVVWFLGCVERVQSALLQLAENGVTARPPVSVAIGADGSIELTFLDEESLSEKHYRLGPPAP